MTTLNSGSLFGPPCRNIFLTCNLHSRRLQDLDISK